MSRRHHCFLFSSLLFIVQHHVKSEQALELAANSINVTYIVINIFFCTHIYITNKQKMWFNVILGSLNSGILLYIVSASKCLCLLCGMPRASKSLCLLHGTLHAESAFFVEKLPCPFLFLGETLMPQGGTRGQNLGHPNKVVYCSLFIQTIIKKDGQQTCLSHQHSV